MKIGPRWIKRSLLSLVLVQTLPEMEKKDIHLFNRFGFGAKGLELAHYRKLDFESYLDSEPVEYESTTFDELINIHNQSNSKEKRERRQDLAQKGMRQLGVNWLRRMINSQAPVREKINLFWHHHFACEIKNPIFAKQFSNHIKKHSLGNFRDLLIGVAQSAAMINYLNLRKNVAANPNEDFARELCELFTLGVDNVYSEQDVKEIARSFTGWAYNAEGQFRIRKKHQDIGQKNIFNSSGSFDGPAVIDLILAQKACARFIAANVFEYFVNPVPNAKHIEELADVLFESDYDLKKLFVHLAGADWFYDNENIMVKIKSPLELIVGLGRQFKIDCPQERGWVYVQRMFDQILYRPPNVAGWKVNKEWINSNSLSLRLRLPSILLADGDMDFELRADLDEVQSDNAKNRKGVQVLKSFSCDWSYFFNSNKGIDYVSLFLNNTISKQAKSIVTESAQLNRENQVLQILSLPEYQMC